MRKYLLSLVLALGTFFWMAEGVAADINWLCDRVCSAKNCKVKSIYEACLTCKEDKMMNISKSSLESCKKSAGKGDVAAYEEAIYGACTGTTCKNETVKKACKDGFNEYEKLAKDLPESKGKQKKGEYGKFKMPRDGAAFKQCENAK